MNFILLKNDLEKEGQIAEKKMCPVVGDSFPGCVFVFLYLQLACSVISFVWILFLKRLN